MNNSLLQFFTNKKVSLFDISIFVLVIFTLSFDHYTYLRLIAQGIAFVLAIVQCKKQQFFSVIPLCCWIALFSFISFFSLLWADLENTTVLTCSLSIVQMGMIAFSISVFCCDIKKIAIVQKLLVFIGLLLSIRYFLIVPPNLWGQYIGMSRFKPFTSNTTAYSLAFSSVASFYYLLKSKKSASLLSNAYYLLVFLSCTFISFCTGSKAAVLIILLGSILLLIFTSKSFFKAACICLLSALFVFLTYKALMNIDFFYKTVGTRFESFFNGVNGVGADKSTETRMLFLQDSFNTFLSHPIFGVGQDGYRYLNSIQYGYFSHCNYTELLANLGIIGFLVFYIPILILIFDSFQLKKKDVLPLVLLLIMLVISFSEVNYSDERTGIIVGMVYAEITIFKNYDYKRNQSFAFAKNGMF